MKVVEQQVGDVKVYVEALEQEPHIAEERTEHGQKKTEWKEVSAGVVRKAQQTLSAVVKEIANDVGDQLATLVAAAAEKAPKSVELSFDLAFSGGLSAYIITGKAEAIAKVKMVWERKS